MRKEVLMALQPVVITLCTFIAAISLALGSKQGFKLQNTYVSQAKALCRAQNALTHS